MITQLAQNITINKKFPLIMIDDIEMSFTRREFDVFTFLYENKGKICTRANIHNIIWGEDHFDAEQIVDTVICRIRKKLKSVGLVNKLITIKGFGYLFVA